MKTIYTSRYGDRHTALYGVVEQSLFADLVAAINIATQLQAEVKRLEAMLENAGDTCHDLQENNDLLRAQVLRLRGELATAYEMMS